MNNFSNALTNFLKVYPVGPDGYGHSKNFEGCTSKSGAFCTGVYFIDGNDLYFNYYDGNLEFSSMEMPCNRIELPLTIDQTAPIDKHK